MQAIITKYLPATDTKGTRIKASCTRGSVIVPWDYAESSERNHALAACELVKRFAQEDTGRYGTVPVENPWLRPFVSGVLLDGSYAHVFMEDGK